jgi:Mg2+ and Co2+ transporter CorA
MNVNVPGADGMGLTWFFAIMLGMVVVSGVTLLFFRPPRLNRALSRYLPSCVG